MAVKPLRDLVYIIPMEDPDKIGSIYIPERAKQRIDQGIVKYRGDAVMELRTGDHVIFSGYSGDLVITEDDGPLYVMQEMDVLAILDDSEPVRVFTEKQILDLVDQAVGLEALKDAKHQGELVKLGERIKGLIEAETIEELRF